MAAVLRPVPPLALPPVRYGMAAAVALAMTAAIFLLMVRLVGNGPVKAPDNPVFGGVTIYQAPEPPAPPPVQPHAPEPTHAFVPEPAMAPLDADAPSAATTLDAALLSSPSDAPALDDLAAGNGSDTLGKLAGNASGDLSNAWTPPGDDKLAKKIAAADAKGAEGYREVLPLSTRQPNIPEVAWQKKIDGWVLVAFTVTAEGRVESVRVLDAEPRGVFEDNVVASVKHWIYNTGDFKGKKVKAQLTQRIELHWKDYPNNNTQLE